MRNESLQMRRVQAAARRSVNEGAEHVKVTMTKEHASSVSRAFFESLDDKGNYEFVCTAE